MVGQGLSREKAFVPGLGQRCFYNTKSQITEKVIGRITGKVIGRDRKRRTRRNLAKIFCAAPYQSQESGPHFFGSSCKKITPRGLFDS